MPFDAIQGQEYAVKMLRRMVESGRIPSAMLFVGPHHVGKRTTALALAQALNCATAPGEGCGVCPPCRKITEGTHPDVEVVEPDGQFIKIDQVRALSDRLGLIPFEARKRVQVLARAERMNPPAANAFLKTLEEPPADTLIVLCAENGARLPETIVSRCLPVPFGLLPRATVAALLAQRGKLEPEPAEFAARLAQGRLLPGLPESAEKWMGLREEVLEALAPQSATSFASISEKISRWSASEDWKFVLNWLETCFRDIALLGAGEGSPHLINQDREGVLQQLVPRFPPSGADGCYRRVLEARDALELHANRALALEAMWLDFRRFAALGGTGR